MKVYIGSDHGGYRTKELLRPYLLKLGYDLKDLGNFKYDSRDDYPDYAKKVARQVGRIKNSRGILICRNGVGVSIVANKTKGVRAVLTSDVKHAKSSRLDDNTNVLCLAQDYLPVSQIKKIAKTWLAAKFSGAVRHRRRLRKVKRIEANRI
ncbi:RpiB/LacA/LacB family sugar-phosphate isomerase [Patescibacteria group bacterium]